ncbi:MarR family transcriptional regulator [Xaviernesmea oryzae]|uniref:MarR family transcriptional regulator n=1 Tax=Xaviernesmea oryzae TaxID=464029 RepID=A0A1Q9AXU1_9HYPH|nr:MarR family transcriptional regulator [Xaviernesmea oryzae]OLP60240.1 MarR family transcriptional regulator [Xaviernesmea oryzae]SEK26847.1 DNA-binding transcriptional regulator, MarR family [Xaviernesmea oryzae]
MSVKLPNDTIGMLLTDVSRLLRGAFDRTISAAGLGLTPGEARALIQVAASGGIKQTEIAQRMGIEPMTLSTYLDRLEGLGLVARVADPNDRRAKHVVLTDQADGVMLAIQADVTRMMESVTAGLGEEARAMLRQSLLTLRDNLQAIDPSCPSGRTPAPPPAPAEIKA